MATVIADEEIPIRDEIPGFPPPQEQKNLSGHEEAERILLEGYRSKRLHHAWIIGGPRGIGKATLAFQFARFVFAYTDRFGETCKNAKSLRDFGSNSELADKALLANTNMLYLSRPWDRSSNQYKTEITVDEIRRTQSFFGTTAGNDGWRVCIVDSADEMNLNAANALLKILEEPPDKCIFLVISHAVGRLLPTIRSRCRNLELNSLDEACIRQVLQDSGAVNDLPPDQVDLAIELAEGSVRRAAMLLVNDGIEIAQGITNIYNALPNANMKLIQSFADNISNRNSKESFELFKEMTRNKIAVMVREGVKKGISPNRLVILTDLWEKTNLDTSLTEEFNLDRKQVVLDTFRHMSDAIAKSEVLQ